MTSTSQSITQRIIDLKQSLPDSVRLIVVTKQASLAAMREAYAAGIRDFGENRLQSALEKQSQLQDLTDLQWHLIGHLQTNKARQATQHFDWVHSVDSLKLAHRLNQVAAERSRPLQILLQVKLLPDPTKFGWTVPELQMALPTLASYTALSIQGLMTILPIGLTPAQQLGTFQELRNLSVELRSQWQPQMPLRELSMGMSDDYLLAIDAGATMIRLGRVIFGG